MSTNDSSHVRNYRKSEAIESLHIQFKTESNTINKGYTKRTFIKTPLFEIVKIQWGGKSTSPIHDHNSDYFTLGYSLILEGVFKNTTFIRLQSGLVSKESDKTYKKGEFIYFPSGTIHQMENISSFMGETLHLYVPPINVMKTYIANLRTTV